MAAQIPGRRWGATSEENLTFALLQELPGRAGVRFSPRRIAYGRALLDKAELGLENDVNDLEPAEYGRAESGGIIIF